MSNIAYRDLNVVQKERDAERHLFKRLLYFTLGTTKRGSEHSERNFIAGQSQL